MKVGIALIVGMCFWAVPAPAQTPATGTSSKPAAQQQATQPPPSHLESARPELPEKPDPAKDAAIRHLMDLTQESRLGDNISGAISMQVHTLLGRGMAEDRLQKFMVDFDQKFHARIPSSQVVDAVVPIYSKNFSMDDIQGLIRFYESPLGQHVVQTMPQVSRESQEAGLNLEKNAALETLRKMTVDYPEISPMLPSDQSKPPAPQTPESKPVPAPAPPAAAKPDTPQQ